jgi:CRP-like cAMP-binding protein
MLLTIERVAILKSVDMFANTPDHVLASVASIVEEQAVYPEETIVREGDIEDSMYIVVEGRVQVHSKGMPIISLGPGQSVGELAVLDPEPRSASVTSMEDTFLFCIGKLSLDEVMADRPEVAQDIIVALCRRIREQGRLIATTNREAAASSLSGRKGD